ncbi:MAG TPA: NifU family protein [bacterium]|nr:NifU family protein [bacterium]HOL48219.1 NifU family protein [bacterium]HPQ18919.1 NifU family protein [bacterium]
MEDKIKTYINEEIAPYLQADGGNIEFVSFEKGVVKVKLQGACHGCPGAMMTLKFGVEQRLREEFPEVKSVEIAN